MGPDLSKISAIRTGRDLLESIVYPSATFARGFEPYTIATEDGRTHSGIIARETTEALVLVSPDRAAKPTSLCSSSVGRTSTTGVTT